MVVKLYTNFSDNKKLNKELVLLSTINATLKSPENSVEDIEIIVENFNINCNYIYVGDFSRYYFVTEKIPCTGHQTKLVCHVDGLMSHKTDLMSTPCIVKRSTNSGSNLIVDSKAVLQNDSIYDIYNFSNGFPSTNKHVLAVCG